MSPILRSGGNFLGIFKDLRYHQNILMKVLRFQMVLYWKEHLFIVDRINSFSTPAFVTSLKQNWERLLPILFLINKMLGWNSNLFIALSTGSLTFYHFLEYTDFREYVKRPPFFKKYIYISFFCNFSKTIASFFVFY